MSVAPRTVTPKHKINDYTVVVSQGAEQGISEGDEFVVDLDGRTTLAKAVDVGQREAVLELNRTDVKSYL